MGGIGVGSGATWKFRLRLYWTKGRLRNTNFRIKYKLQGFWVWRQQITPYSQSDTGNHRRRIYTEEKANVVATVWGTKFIQFLALLAILHQDDLKNRMNSSFSSYLPGAIHPFLRIILVQFILFFKSSWCKIASRAGNWIIFVAQTATTTFAFSST